MSALKTLLFFTVLMVTLPIGLYFATKAYVFEGTVHNTTLFVFALRSPMTEKLDERGMLSSNCPFFLIKIDKITLYFSRGKEM